MTQLAEDYARVIGLVDGVNVPVDPAYKLCFANTMQSFIEEKRDIGDVQLKMQTAAVVSQLGYTMVGGKRAASSSYGGLSAGFGAAFGGFGVGYAGAFAASEQPAIVCFNCGECGHKSNVCPAKWGGYA